MTNQNIDEFIMFVLKKYGEIMLFAIARYIRKEFNRDINTKILLDRTENMYRQGKLKRSESPMFKGYYYRNNGCRTKG